MTTDINQYAERVYSEHPIAMWSLDETVYYIALANENSRFFTNWDLTGCYADDSPDLIDITSSPFPSSNIYSSITKSNALAGTVRVVSPVLFGAGDINSSISTFCVNIFLYQKPTYINWFKVGYRYLDALSVQQEVLSDEILPPEIESWVNFNNVYPIPESFSGNLEIVIEIDFDESSSDLSSRTLIMNGLSVGQGSETTCYENLGSQFVSLPDTTNISGMYGVSADQYGILSNNGYYLVRNNELLSKNDAFPIIFGAKSSTKIYPSNVNLPSFIFPGRGMLNEAGRNKQYTLEMWIKLDPKTNSAKKIIGPLSGDDGIYVKEGFITLVIGDEIASHCVSEWYRPMLIHIQMKENNASLVINGEQVLSIPLNRKTIDLPNDTDWWGVYSYPSIEAFNIDCISIYPYIISDIVAKKRFVYGQATPGIQSIDNGFSGTPITMDFSTAEYNSNIIYPDIARWDAGYFNNLNATKNYISVPDYTLPNINIGGRDVQQWYRDNYIVYGLDYPSGESPYFITFRPNITYDINGDPVSWSSEGIDYVSQSYLNFPSLSLLNDSLSAVYGIFEVEEDIAEPRTLMSFVNTINGNTFDINIESDKVKYLYNGAAILDTSGNPAERDITIGTEILVGLNFESSGIEFGYDISRFFSAPSSTQLYIGGNGTNTFEGKIYLVGFSNQTNYEEISTNFSSDGLAITDNYELLFDHIASYTLVPEREYGHLFLDVSVSSQWEEYFPLTYFASYVKDENGNPIYDLDMLQVNLGYVSVESNVVWTYAELKDAYLTLDYQDLKDSTYENYFNLKKNNTTGNSINVSNSSLQAYLTFQSIAEGANLPLSDFTYTKQLDESHVIDPDLENTDIFTERAYQTKFVFTDNVIVYPPKSKSFEEYAMVAHFNIKQRSILKNPLKIKSFEITSKNLNYANNNADQRNYVGTKFGTKMYPEIDFFGTLDGKSKNPFFMYKTATPYIYTTKKSGVKVVNKSSIVNPTTINQYRVSIPVNSNASYSFKVGAITFFLLGDLPETIDEIPFVEINYKNGLIALILNKTESETIIKAYSKPTYEILSGGDSSTTNWIDYWDCGYSDSLPNVFINIDIASLDQSNDPTGYTEITGLSFYQNGKYVKSPSIKNNEWNSIGISFPDQLDFSEYAEGGISLYGGFTFNDISYYLSEGLGIKTDLNIRTWDGVLNDDYVGDPVTPENIWSYWSGEKWEYVYVLGQSTSYLSTPADIYEAYTGTNRYIIDDGYGVQLQQTQTAILTDVSWSVYTDKPA